MLVKTLSIKKFLYQKYLENRLWEDPLWIILGFLVTVYLLSGFYRGYPGDPIQYLQLSYLSDQWSKVPLHFGYYAIIYAFGFWANSFDQALVVQALTSIFAGTIGLWSIYGITQILWRDGWLGWRHQDIAIIVTMSVGLNGAYWIFAIMGEVIALQTGTFLLSFYLFNRQKYFLGAGAFFISCTMTPLAGLAVLPILYIFTKGLSKQSKEEVLLSVCVCIIWFIALVILYYYYKLIPGIHYSLSSGSTGHLGHTLPNKLIPWSKTIINLTKMYIRSMPILLGFSFIGFLASLRINKLLRYNLLALSLIAPYLFLIRRLADGWEHTSIWGLLFSGYAAIGLLVIGYWLERQFAIKRWWFLSIVFGLQFIGTTELLIIPQHTVARSFNQMGQTMVLLDTPKTMWLCSKTDPYGVILTYGFSKQGRIPGDGWYRDFKPKNIMIFPESEHDWGNVHSHLKKGGRVFVVHENKRWLGPLLAIIREPDGEPFPKIDMTDKTTIRLERKLVKQVGFYGIYQLSQIK